MKYKKIKTLEGEIVEVPVVNVGDKITVFFEDNSDIELSEELEEFEGDLIVSEVDYETYSVYVKGIDYAIGIDFIADVVI